MEHQQQQTRHEQRTAQHLQNKKRQEEKRRQKKKTQMQCQNKMDMSEREFVHHLARYVVQPKLHRIYGYPTECADQNGGIEIYHHYDYAQARTYDNKDLKKKSELAKHCIRCARTFYVANSGEYLKREDCTHHSGKLDNTPDGDRVYNCCYGDRKSEGCTQSACHIWNGIELGVNGPYDDFLWTCPRKAKKKSKGSKVYALDCEMVYTGRGMEVARSTLVGWNGQVVYDYFVQPTSVVLDYCTRYSGVTANDLCSKTNKCLKTFTEVQTDLLGLIKADTILIGHSLENDLRVLRLVHKRIVDTSHEFRHPRGFPYKYALRTLSQKYLQRDIQCNDTGHNSIEDAIVTMELMKWKIEKFIREK